MKSVAVALVAFSLLSGAALAAGDIGAPALLDDATVDAQFQCPETLADADAREAEFHRYLVWARAAHPDWNVRKRLDVRYGLLRRHACAQTMANIASAARPAFGP